jgi:hypothetical protein
MSAGAIRGPPAAAHATRGVRAPATMVARRRPGNDGRSRKYSSWCCFTETLIGYQKSPGKIA